MVFYQQTAVNGGAIPEDEHFPGHLFLEMAQELNDLGTLDASGMDLEVEAPERQAADDREALPVKGFLEHRGLPAWRPDARPRGMRTQAALVDKDDGAPPLAGFF